MVRGVCQEGRFPALGEAGPLHDSTKAGEEERGTPPARDPSSLPIDAFCPIWQGLTAPSGAFGSLASLLRPAEDEGALLRVQGVSHIRQNSARGFVCRHACLKMVRAYLQRRLGISKRDARRLLGSDIPNGKVSWVGGKHPKTYRSTLTPNASAVTAMADRIDGMLAKGFPPILYVRYPVSKQERDRGMHVVVVTEKMRLPDGAIAYRILDPGTSGINRGRAIMAFDPARGTFIKKGGSSGKVARREYALAGVFDYTSAPLIEAVESATKRRARII